MKQWSFKVRYEVTRICTIDADTAEEAKDLFDANEWIEGNDIDCVLQDADEPDWETPEEDEDDEDEEN